MKRFGQLWEKIISFDNLYLAYRKARRGKQNKNAVAQFSLNLEYELLKLQQELSSQTYKPGEYQLFTIYERKPRQIAAAPFRDRVVHHALLNIVEPLIDKRFIFDSYACRKGKGVHLAITRYQHWAQRYRYVLKMDIAQYFPSINREFLKQKIHRYLKDHKTLDLFEKIIDNAPSEQGIPIGNLTSQFLANLFLDDFDHYIQKQLKISTYLRYVDDFLILADDKTELHQIREKIKIYLANTGLLLHPRKAHISPTSGGLDLLGYRIFPYFRRLRNDNGHRFQHKLQHFSQKYAAGEIQLADCRASICSWIVHAHHADTEGLRKKIFSDTLFKCETVFYKS